MKKKRFLSKRGVKQTKLLSKRFKDVRFSKIYSSPLERCKQTTDIINKQHSLPVVYDEGLKEVSGKIKEFPEKHKKEIAIIKKFYSKLIKEKGKILVSSSGIINRILLGMLLGIPINKTNFIQNPGFEGDASSWNNYPNNELITLRDCNDNNQNIYPGAQESCNNVDDNCDGVIDSFCSGQRYCSSGSLSYLCGRCGISCPSGYSCSSGGTECCRKIGGQWQCVAVPYPAQQQNVAAK